MELMATHAFAMRTLQVVETVLTSSLVVTLILVKTTVVVATMVINTFVPVRLGIVARAEVSLLIINIALCCWFAVCSCFSKM